MGFVEAFIPFFEGELAKLYELLISTMLKYNIYIKIIKKKDPDLHIWNKFLFIWDFLIKLSHLIWTIFRMSEHVLDIEYRFKVVECDSLADNLVMQNPYATCQKVSESNSLFKLEFSPSYRLKNKTYKIWVIAAAEKSCLST